MAHPVSNVFEFDDFRKFLEDYQAKRKAQDRSFTRSKFCRILGLPNTRSYFNDIVKGTRPLSKAYAEKFAEALGLDEQEARYFRILVEFNQSDSPRDRDLLFDQLISLNRAPARFVSPDEYEFYRQWHHIAVYSFLDVIAFRGDHAALARRILPPITAVQARASISLLKKLKLIRRRPDGSWKAVAKTLDAGSYLRSALIQQYQLQCLELSKRAMLTEHRAVRNFSTIALSVSRKGFDRIEQKLQHFKEEARSIAHQESEPADRVYQLNVQFFPLALPERSP